MIKCTILKNKYTCVINTEILTYTYNKEKFRKFLGIGKYRTKYLPVYRMWTYTYM